MPKIKAPTTTEVTTEEPKVNLAPLVESLVSGLEALESADAAVKSSTLDIVTEVHAFRDANPEAERVDIRLAIQTAVATKTGLKLSQVQSSPKEGEKMSKEIRAARASAYTLVSKLLTMSWPSDEERDKKVKKLLADGETRFTVIDAAARPNKKTKSDSSTSTITRENFVEKFSKFLGKAETDLPAPMSEILDLAYAAIETIQKTLSEAA